MMNLFGCGRSVEGDILNQFQHPLKLQDGGRIHVIFPVIVCHVIDESSPLYTLSASDFLEKRHAFVQFLNKHK